MVIPEEDAEATVEITLEEEDSEAMETTLEVDSEADTTVEEPG